ncbi:MAG TPA: hypothetical protein VMX94_10220 [Armatimonadota bacterium]|nr:hypothetical protein [Armatimonadota bacterium]
MKRLLVLGVALLISPFWCSQVLARALPIPKGQVTSPSNWPKELTELVNRENRVYGMSGGPYPPMYRFYFVGDTQGFNGFVGQIAKLRGTPVELIVHPGPGVTSYSVQQDSTVVRDDKVLYDWELVVPEDLERRDQRVADSPPRITINVYLGGGIDLRKVVVPLNIEVKSSGEIERFVADHKAKQEQVETSRSK